MLYRFCLFILFFALLGCDSNHSSDSKLYNQLIESYRISNDLTLFDADYPTLPKEDVLAIRYIFEGLEFMKHRDGVLKESTDLFDKAVHIMEHSDNSGLKQWVNSQIGFYYYNYREYYQATPYFIDIDRSWCNDPTVFTIQPEDVLLKTAYFFETFKKYDRSIRYYKHLLSLASADDNNSSIIWALGFSYLKSDSLGLAHDYFVQAKDKAFQYGDTLRYAKSLGALGQVSKERGNLALAQELLEKDVMLSEHLKEERNLMYSQLELGKFYIETAQYDKAEEILNRSLTIADDREYYFGFEQDIVSQLLRLSTLTKQTEKELEYRRSLAELDTKVRQKGGEQLIKDISWQTAINQVNLELEAKESTIEKIHYQRVLLIFFLLFVLVVLFLLRLFYRRRLQTQSIKFQSKLQGYELDKMKSETKLKQTFANLESYKVYLEEKNEQISKLEHTLTKLTHSSNDLLKQKVPLVIDLLDSHLMTDDNWLVFKQTFSQEQEEYFNYIQEEFPDLTESNLRIVLLQRLGLSNQQTAGILGVTVEAVKKNKQRIKKKYAEKYESIFDNQLVE